MRTETVSALTARIRAAPPRAGGVRVAAVEGRSGSGKTRLAGALAAELGWPVFHLEDVYPGWGGLARAADLLALWVVMPLLNGANPRWRRYDWERGVQGGWESTPVTDGLIVEGCGCGSTAVRPYLSTLVWLDTPAQVRAERLSGRADAALYGPYRAMWARQEDAFYAQHRPREHADAIVLNPS